MFWSRNDNNGLIFVNLVNEHTAEVNFYTALRYVKLNPASKESPRWPQRRF